MAEYLHFSRDSRLYMAKDGRLWSIPVLDGFSFSQATNSSEITLNEMEDASGRSRRGRKMFTDSLSAAEWSFSTYVRPFKSAGNGGSVLTGTSTIKGRADSTATHHHAVEEALWVAMAGQNVYVPTTGKFKHGATGGAISSLVIASGETDADSGDRVDATYNIAIPTVGADADASATVTGGTQQGGTNAVIKVVVSSGTAVATVTERGQKFETGQSITIGDELMGGDGTGDALVLTVTSESFTSDATDMDINFYDSSRASLGTFDLYYVFSDRSDGRLIYKLENAVVNEAAIDFDIDGIATVNWSGMAGQIKEVPTGLGAGQYTAQDTYPNPGAAGAIWIDTNDSDRFYMSTSATNAEATWWAAIDEASTSTSNFIRNRLTNLTLAPETAFKAATSFTNAAGNSDTYETSYSVAITGGNVTISNNISYLTPEELGKVNQPIEHITGTRSVSGSLTCYLASSDAATNRSRDLFADLVSDTNTVINKFAITLAVGGTDTTKPRFEISVPTAHLEIPSHSIEDVISLETNFSGVGTGVSEGDEITLKYIGV
jgi:hypothetical protein|tara:strand:+ start:4154 stop:5797 length:1644 start_codon:yes stop_codon:yes gene_type:complete